MFKILAVSIVALGLVACQKGGDKKSTGGDTFVYCSEGSPSAFNPQVTTDGTSSNAAAKTIYDTLVAFVNGETTIEPRLAESYTVSDDGLTYTFKLRKDVAFHTTDYFTPARNFNADDVLFSFNRQMMKEHPYHDVGGGTYDYFQGMEMGTIITKLEKLDDHTVRFTLSRPEAPFLANLAMGFASILSKEYADKLALSTKMDDIDHKPVGTGPFIYQKYVKDTLIRYKANDLYFKGAPHIKKLVFAITPDASVRFQKLKTGECHFINEPAPQDLPGMKDDSSIVVMTREGLNVGYLAMNTERAPLDNKLVRQAINHALNRKSYIDAIYLGNAVVATNPIPPTMWGYDKNLDEYKYDPAKSKELLKKAGFANGFETELWTLPVSRPYNPNGKKMGEMMQADLAKVGIKIKLVSYDWPTYLDKSRKGEHALIQLGWTGDNGDPDNFLNTLLGCSSVEAGSNVARWCYKGFNDAVQNAKIKTSKEERSTLYKKAQKIFKEEAPWVTLAHSIVFRAMKKNIEGYKIDPFGHDIFTRVRFKED